MRVTSIKSIIVLAAIIGNATSATSAPSNESISYYYIDSPPPLWLVTVFHSELDEILPRQYYEDANRSISSAFDEMKESGLNVAAVGFFWVPKEAMCRFYPLDEDLSIIGGSSDAGFAPSECVVLTEEIKAVVDYRSGRNGTLHVYRDMRREMKALKAKIAALEQEVFQLYCVLASSDRESCNL